MQNASTHPLINDVGNIVTKQVNLNQEKFDTVRRFLLNNGVLQREVDRVTTQVFDLIVNEAVSCFQHGTNKPKRKKPSRVMTENELVSQLYGVDDNQ